MRLHKAMLIGLIGLLAPVSAFAQHAGCRAADTATTKILVYVKAFATMSVPARDSVGLAGVDTALVVAESDSVKCVQVALVVDSVFAKTVTLPYVVVRAGSRFVAYQPSNDPDKPSQLLHFVDTTYLYRRTIVAF